jgi:2-dehydro-3-deoxyphosphogluconate aldolase / (4S)-4-hydroxy-2-oxoglutarate aldolase
VTCIEKIETAGLIAVLDTADAAEAVQAVKALSDGGISCLEIMFRSAEIDRTAQAISEVRKAFPDLTVGAGTVINKTLAEKAVKAGAQFIVSPGFNEETIDYCMVHAVQIFPGVSAPSEIERALSKNLALLKFFPAEALGGPAMLKALGGPFPQIKFLPSGGLTAENVGSYSALDNVAAVSGSWMVQKQLVADKNWAEITRLSHEAVLAVLGFTFAHLGINYSDPAACAQGVSELGLFGFKSRETEASWFCGESFELMKNSILGKNGHIGIMTYSIERALAYLEPYGYHPVWDTAKWTGEPQKSMLQFIYLDKALNGFSVHLKRR